MTSRAATKSGTAARDVLPIYHVTRGCALAPILRSNLLNAKENCPPQHKFTIIYKYLYLLTSPPRNMQQYFETILPTLRSHARYISFIISACYYFAILTFKPWLLLLFLGVGVFAADASGSFAAAGENPRLLSWLPAPQREKDQNRSAPPAITAAAAPAARHVSRRDELALFFLVHFARCSQAG